MTATRSPSRRARRTLVAFVVALLGASCGDDPLIAGLDTVDSGDGLALGEVTAPPDAPPDVIDDDADSAPIPPDTDTPRDEATSPPDTTVEDTQPPDTGVDTAPAPDDTSTPIADTDDADDADVDDDALPPADESQLSAPPYLMWVTQTEVSVRWETRSPLVGRVDFGLDDALGRTIVEAEPATTHELRLTGLTPDHRHAYRIVYGGGALPIRHFHTAPPDDSDAPFSFIVWGDNQDGPDVFSALVPVMAAVEPRFAVSVGDCVQNGTRGEYRDQLFAPMNAFADEVPYLVAAGNHERYGDSNARLFDEYFSQPGDEHCFGWRYGGLFILFIDTELGLDGAEDQRECINRELRSEAATTATLRAAAFHKPPRIEWWFGGFLAFPDSLAAPWVREDLEPLLEAHGVDIVFNGHNHLYAHTPETPGGITWVTTGGGGGRIDDRGILDVWRVGTWPQIETTIHDYHFLVATMDGDSLLIEAVDLDGEVMHIFAVFAD